MKFLRRKNVDLKIIMSKKEKILNLLAQANKSNDFTRVNYLQGQVDILEEIVNDFR